MNETVTTILKTADTEAFVGPMTDIEAVNTGDAMNLLAVDSVLSNLPTLGLALIHEIMHKSMMGQERRCRYVGRDR